MFLITKLRKHVLASVASKNLFPSENFYSTKILSTLDGKLDDVHKHVREINKENMKNLTKKYNLLMKETLEGGGKKGVERHVVRNKKMLARDRISLLLDKDSTMLELSAFAGFKMKYGNIPCAGLVTVIGKVHGVWCLICANDATVKGGSMFPIGVKKQLRVQQIAEENNLPVIYLIDSGGAYLPLQAEIFNEGGKSFYNQAIMSSKGISQIALVCGSCTAGAAYIPTMADEAVIIHKTGTVFLGGPPLVLAATGERVTSEQLGGATVHCTQSGCTDHFSMSEEAAIDKVRDIVATLNIESALSGLENDSGASPPKFKELELNELIPAKHKFHQLDVRLILSRLVDSSKFHEFKASFATTIVCGFATIDNILVGIVASNGRLTGSACLKATHFVQLCSQRQTPIIYLQHFEGEEKVEGNVELNNSTIKNRAQLLQATCCASVPSICVTYGGVTGSPESCALGSLSTGSRFHFIFPNVVVGLSDPESLCLQAAEQDKTADMEELYQKFKVETESFHAANNNLNDGVILPEHLRKTLSTCLSIFKQSNIVKSLNSVPTQPFIRM